MLNNGESLKFSEASFIQQAVESLKAVLREAGQVSDEADNDRLFDATLKCKTDAGQITITVDVKSRAWPQEIEGIGLQARERTRSRFGTKSMTVIAAPIVSDDAAKTLRAIDVSWIDEAGNCELRSRGLYIRVAGRVASRQGGEYRLDPFGPQPSKALAVLIENPGRAWTLRDLADAAGVSLGTTSLLRNALRQRGYLLAGHGENRLTNVRELVAEWATEYRPARKEHRYYTIESLPILEKALSDHGTTLTEFSSAERLAPYTRYQRIACYAPLKTLEDAKKLGLRRGDAATNVVVYTAPAPLGTPREIEGVRIASPIQTFLDLMALGGRGVDAAEHLRDEVILPPWDPTVTT